MFYYEKVNKFKQFLNIKCLCIVEFCDVQAIIPPLTFDHQGNMDVWLIIKKLETMENDELIFETKAMFREWLESKGAANDGVWLIFSKTKMLKTLSALEALEEALCFGWIDGQMQSIDDDRYRKYFARRKAKSNWSDKNKELAQRLIEQGLMTRQGLDAISCAKQNGEWDKTKCSAASDEQIMMFKQLIEPYEPAYTNLLTMSNSVQRTYTLFYFDAKSDKTRQARLEKIIERLNNNLRPM